MPQSVLGRESDLLGKQVYVSLGNKKFTKERITRFTWGNKQITYCHPGDNIQGKQKRHYQLSAW